LIDINKYQFSEEYFLVFSSVVWPCGWRFEIGRKGWENSRQRKKGSDDHHHSGAWFLAFWVSFVWADRRGSDRIGRCIPTLFFCIFLTSCQSVSALLTGCFGGKCGGGKSVSRRGSGN